LQVSKIKVTLIYEKDNRASLLPVVEGIPNEGFWSTFRRLGQVQPFYEIPQPGNRIIRILQMRRS